MKKRQDAIDFLTAIKNTCETRREGNRARIPIDDLDIGALSMAISDMRKMSYITDRPCAVCKFNEDGNGCKKLTCVFEDDGKENV